MSGRQRFFEVTAAVWDVHTARDVCVRVHAQDVFGACARSKLKISLMESRQLSFRHFISIKELPEEGEQNESK